MELTIYTYGYGYHLFNSLTALAMLRSSSLYPAIINMTAMLVTSYYAVRIAAASSGAQWQQYVKKILGMVLLINALLIPQTSMNVKDNISKKIWRVDHLPLAFALPIGVLESFGNIIAQSFEQAFLVVGGRSSFDYYNYGMVYGARLAREVMQAEVRDPDFTSNMKHFIERCVILPAMIGEQFTKEELVATQDVWSLVKKQAGSFTRVPMSARGARKSPSPTCAEATNYFEQVMQRSLQHDLTNISVNLQTPGIGLKHSSAHQVLNKALTNQIEALYGNQHKVEDIFKHNMLLNALDNYRAAKYPAVKAQLQYESSGLISGELADKILTGLQAVFKNLVYSSFIFMVPLMLLAGGMSKYRGWITVCLSLQLWPPLMSVLNMIIDIAYDPAEIVSYSSWSTEKKRLDSIASMAANLKLLIPVLAVYVTRMGEGSFLNIAGSLMSAGQGAVASAASEAASGNISYDNQSIGNSNNYNVNENKYDTNQQFVSGTNSYTNPDGSIQKILPTGQVITTAGSGVTSSVGEASYRSLDGVNTSLHEGMREEEQLVASEEARFSEAKENLISETASALTSIAENTRTDEGYSIDTSTDEGRELADTVSKIDEYSKSHNLSFRLGAQGYIRAEKSIPGIVKFVSGVDATVGAEISSGLNYEYQRNHSSRSSEDETYNHRMGYNERTNNQSAWLESQGLDQNQQKAVSDSYNEAKRLEESVAIHKDKVEVHNQALEYSRSHANELSQDLTQEVIDQYVDRYQVSDREAELAVRYGDQKARDVFSEINKEQANLILEKINRQKANVNSSSLRQDLVTDHTDKINKTPLENSKKVNDFMKQKGIKNRFELEGDINRKKQHVINEHSEGIEEALLPHERKQEEKRQRELKKQNEDIMLDNPKTIISREMINMPRKPKK